MRGSSFTCVQFKYVPTDGEYTGLFICLILQAKSLSTVFSSPWEKRENNNIFSITRHYIQYCTYMGAIIYILLLRLPVSYPVYPDIRDYNWKAKNIASYMLKVYVPC